MNELADAETVDERDERIAALERDLAGARETRDQLLLDRATEDEKPNGQKSYLVCAVRPRKDTVNGLSTVVEPQAVFRAHSPEEACKIVAAKTKRLETYFAVEGFPWGVELLHDDDSVELGAELEEDDLNARMRALERRQLDRGY